MDVLFPIGRHEEPTKWRKNYGTSDKIMKLCETSTMASTLMHKKRTITGNGVRRASSRCISTSLRWFVGSFVGLRWFSYNGSVSSDNNDKNEVKLIDAYHVTVGLCVWLLAAEATESRKRENYCDCWSHDVLFYIFYCGSIEYKPRTHTKHRNYYLIRQFLQKWSNRMTALVTLVLQTTKCHEHDIAEIKIINFGSHLRRWDIARTVAIAQRTVAN